MNWESFIANLTDGKIIPVIGNDLCLIKDQDDKPIPFQQYIAGKLKLWHKIDDTEQRLSELAAAYPNENIIPTIDSIYNQIDEDRFYTEPLEKLAEITDFKFYISTALDDRLEKALRKTRNLKENELEIIDYSLKQNNNTPADNEGGPPVTVFNLLGSLRNIRESAFTEEEKLEHFFSLSNKEEPNPPLADYFMKRVKNKILLFIGCDFPDWFMRFIIRILTNERYKLRIFSDYIVSEDSNKYPELHKFLEPFKKNIITTGMDRGGIVKAFIEDLHKIWSESQNHPVRYEGSVFLSYNHPDQEKVKTLKQLLRAKGIRNAWFDIEDLASGEHQVLIEEEIKKCKVFIPLISNNSLTNNQSYTWKVEWAGIEGRLTADKYYGKMSFQIIPIVLDNTARNDERIPRFMRDFSIWDLDKNKDRIIEEITKELSPIMKNE